ncbi:hypothetical protein [Streptomyces sp. NPDC046909]|uniref:hypothetical protein n=1 Tax=Streptomyces sp. NPDC046909 TaxID=3155617 RepID=UPI0033D389A6
MSSNGRSFAILAPDKNVNYGRQELPSARDGQIRDLLLGVTEEVGFDRIKNLMPRYADQVLSAFAERAASIAVRHQDARELRAGLLAAAIANSITGDEREALPALALLHRAAEMIGNDPRLEFSSVYEIWGGREGALAKFLRRSPEDKTIEAMGYEEGDDKRGFRFFRNW